MLTKSKLATATSSKFKDALQKRCDELRHYLNIVIEDNTSEDDDEEMKEEDVAPTMTAGETIAQRQRILLDQRFYKRIALFNQLCYTYFKDDFT